MLTIGPFRLDAANQRLEHNGAAVELSPKAMSVLHLLASNPGRLISKQELLDAIWPDTFVQEGVLKVYIKEIRKALGDDAGEPRYIQTEHRRGYRFLVGGDSPAARTAGLPGRAEALARLHQHFTAAREGSRRIVFLTGEAGIGKTTLVDRFLADLRVAGEARIGRGQCVEQSGETEAYFPFLGALAGLAGDDESVAALLRTAAPAWAIQMRQVYGAADREQFAREVIGAGTARMMREALETIGPLAESRALVLALEDLHWSDPSTVELLGALARQTGVARLMVLATFRPVDVILSKHPVRAMKMDLAGRGLAHEIPLELLSAVEIGAYLTQRAPGIDTAEMAEMLQRETSGNPLFLEKALDYFVERKLAATERGRWSLTRPIGELEPLVPLSLREIVQGQFERLTPARRQIAEAAAVAGAQFSAEAVAAMAGLPERTVEDECVALAQFRHFFRFDTEEDVARFRFVHELYRECVLAGMAEVQKRRLHEAAARYGESHREAMTASVRAHHWEAAGNAGAAFASWIESAREASRRYAKQEALLRLERGAALLARLPEGSRLGQELELTIVRALLFRAAGDMPAAAAEWEKAAELSLEVGSDSARIDAMLWAAATYMWIDRERSVRRAAQAVELSRQYPGSLLEARAIGIQAYLELYLNRWKPELWTRFEQARVQVDREGAAIDRLLFGVMGATLAAFRGDYRQGLAWARQAVQLAQKTGDAFEFCLASFFEGIVLELMGKWGDSLRVLRRTTAIAEKSGFLLAASYCRMNEAWVRLGAGDPSLALALSEPAWTQRAMMASKTLIGALLATADLLARALLLERKPERSAEVLEEAESIRTGNGLEAEPVLDVRFSLGAAACFVEVGNHNRAAEFAERAFTKASWTPDPPSVALALRMKAVIAARLGDEAAARTHSKAARQALEGAQPSHADWAVHMTAAEIEGGSEREREAVAALAAIKGSLEGEPALLERFLAMPQRNKPHRFFTAS